MPITDEALLQIIFKQHEGQPIEFIMAEYGKAKQLYQKIEQELARSASCPTIDIQGVQIKGELPAAGENNATSTKHLDRRNLKCDPKEAIKADSIICCVCKKSFKILNSRHLKSHGISVEEYKELCRYPKEQLLMSQQEAEKAIERGKELAKASTAKRASGKVAASETAPTVE